MQGSSPVHERKVDKKHASHKRRGANSAGGSLQTRRPPHLHVMDKCARREALHTSPIEGSTRGVTRVVAQLHFDYQCKRTPLTPFKRGRVCGALVMHVHLYVVAYYNVQRADALTPKPVSY